MLQKIMQFFDNHLSVPQEKDSTHQILLATTALFIEMMLQDGKEHSNEKDAVKQAVQKHFNVSNHDFDELFLLAQEELKHSTDYYQFTQLINNNFSQAQKIKIIENLWTIAYADSHLDDMEEQLVRKVAELIHVPHMQFSRTKLKVKNG